MKKDHPLRELLRASIDAREEWVEKRESGCSLQEEYQLEATYWETIDELLNYAKFEETLEPEGYKDDGE